MVNVGYQKSQGSWGGGKKNPGKLLFGESNSKQLESGED